MPCFSLEISHVCAVVLSIRVATNAVRVPNGRALVKSTSKSDACPVGLSAVVVLLLCFRTTQIKALSTPTFWRKRTQRRSNQNHVQFGKAHGGSFSAKRIWNKSIPTGQRYFHKFAFIVQSNFDLKRLVFCRRGSMCLQRF